MYIQQSLSKVYKKIL